ncbi:MAG: XdhC family protein [Desulfocapsaceae bacterium]
MIKLLFQLRKRFAAGEPVMVATIVGGQGVSPRKAGTGMLFFHDHTSSGSVGGGLLEAAVARRVGELWALWTSSAALLEWFGAPVKPAGIVGGRGKDAPCGGRQQILIRLLLPTNHNAQVLDSVLEVETATDPLYLITRLEGGDSKFSRVDFYCATGGSGSLQNVDKQLLKALIGRCGAEPLYLSEPMDDQAFLVERVERACRLYIFGSGHVAVALAELGVFVGFEIVVVDDSDRYTTHDQFPAAARFVIQENFEQALDGLRLDQKSFAVILTRSHRGDRLVLQQVLGTEAGYIGMIGSRTKIARCFELLREQGVGEDRLARVYAPVGLDIGAQTPEEIALSIVAQLIKVRACSPDEQEAGSGPLFRPGES